MDDYSEWTKEMMFDEMVKMQRAVNYFHQEIVKRQEGCKKIYDEIDKREQNQRTEKEGY